MRLHQQPDGSTTLGYEQLQLFTDLDTLREIRELLVITSKAVDQFNFVCVFILLGWATFSDVFKRRQGPQPNDTQNNDTQLNDIQHNNK
jgi:hypothetical protein